MWVKVRSAGCAPAEGGRIVPVLRVFLCVMMVPPYESALRSYGTGPALPALFSFRAHF